MTVPWWVIIIIAVLSLVAIAFFVGRDIYKSEAKKRKRSIIVWACVLALGIGVYFAVDNSDYAKQYDVQPPVYFEEIDIEEILQGAQDAFK